MEFYQDTQKCNEDFHRGKMFIVDRIDGQIITHLEMRSRFYICTYTIDKIENTIECSMHGSPNAPYGLAIDYLYPSAYYNNKTKKFEIGIPKQKIDSSMIDIDIQAMKMLKYTLEQIHNFMTNN